MGLRWETGSDWNAYLEHFKEQSYNAPFSNNKFDFERGYNFFVSITKFFVPEYSFFLLVHAVIFFYCIKKSFLFFTPYLLTAILLFYVGTLGIWGSNRQLIAAAIGLVAITYLYEKKITIYFILVFVAFLFHTTSLLLLTFLFINKYFNKYFIIFVLIIASIIGFSEIPYVIFSFFGSVSELASYKSDIYLSNAKENAATISVIGFIKRLTIFFIFLSYRDKIIVKAPKFNFVFNGYILSLIFYLIFAQTMPVMISRGSIYFNILEPVVLSYIFYLTTNRKITFAYSICMLLYCFLTLHQSIASYPDLFDPYKGIFINSDYQRNMY